MLELDENLALWSLVQGGFQPQLPVEAQYHREGERKFMWKSFPSLSLSILQECYQLHENHSHS